MPPWPKLALVAALVVTHHLARPRIERAFSCAPDGPDTSDAALVLLDWNLHNFPGPTHDRAAIAARIATAAPDLIALQEIGDRDALAALLPEHTILLSQGGGSHAQSLGLALAPGTEALAPLLEHDALTLGGRVRPAVSTYVRTRAGLDFHVVVVHLKATPDGAALRRLQWAALAIAIARARATGPGAGDDDLVVLGDFNTTGAPGHTSDDELAELDATMSTLGLRRVVDPRGCSAYWDGSRRDAWLEPALLDHAFVGGFTDTAPRAHAIGACARARCQPLRSTPAHPDPDIAGASDHCPLVVAFERAPG